MENASDFAGLVRTLRTVSGQANQWDLYDANNVNPVASSGTYLRGGVIVPAYSRTLNSSPRIFSAGPSGIAANLSNTSSTGYWNASRPLKIALVNSLANYLAGYAQEFGADPKPTFTAQCALAWWGSGKPGSGSYRDCMIWGLQNFHQYISTTALGINYPPTEYYDYRFEVYYHNPILAYDLGREALSAAEKEHVADYFMNDLDYTQGGHDYPGTSYTLASNFPVTGRITVTYGSKTVNCATTCNFNGELHAGDIINYENPNNLGELVRVASDPVSDTSFEITAPAVRGFTNVNWQAAPGWNNTQYGLMHLHKRSNWTSIAKNFGLSYSEGQSIASEYGEIAGIYASDSWNNHTFSNLMADIMFALVLIEDDPRAEMLFIDAAFTYYVLAQRDLMTSWTPINGVAEGYHTQRNTYTANFYYAAMRNAFTDSPEFINPEWWAMQARYGLSHSIFRNHSNSNFVWPFQNSSDWYLNFGKGQELNKIGWLMLGAADVNSGSGTWASHIRHWLANQLSEFYSAASTIFIEGDNDFRNPLFNGAWQLNLSFLMDRPDISPVQFPNTSFPLLTTLADECDATYGTSRCSGFTNSFAFANHEAAPRYGIASFSGLTPGDSHVWIDWNSFSLQDQGNQGYSLSTVSLAVRNDILMSGDGPYLYGASEGGGVLSIGGANFVTSHVQVGRVGITRQYATADVMAATANLTGYYTAGAAATGVYETFVHLKGTGANKDIIISKITGSTSSSKAFVKRHHFRTEGLSGCPSSCGSFISFSTPNLVLTADSDSRLIVKLDNSAGTAVDTEGASATNGSYTGGAGYTFRVTQSKTGTAINWTNVFRPAPSNSETMADPTRGTDGAFTTIHQPLADGTDYLAAISDHTNGTSVTMSASYSGNAQLVVVGLQAGTYKVQSDGVNVSGCDAIEVASGSHVLNCDAVPDGTITVGLSGGGSTPSSRISGGRIVDGRIR